MWSCPRCGARNGRDAEHCGRCGMPSPLRDGGTTKTIDIPMSESDEPRAVSGRSSLSWVAIVAAVVVLLGLLLLAVVVLLN